MVAALLFDLILLPCLFRIVVLTLQPAFYRLPLWAVFSTMLLVGLVAPFALLFVNVWCLSLTLEEYRLEFCVPGTARKG